MLRNKPAILITDISAQSTTGLGMGGGGGLGVGVGGPSLGMGVGLGAGGLHNGAQDLTMPKREQRNGDEEEEGRNPSVTSPFGPSRSKAETSEYLLAAQF